jgi:hypothetical protein
MTPGPWNIGTAHLLEDGGTGSFEIEAKALGIRNLGGDYGRVAIVDFCEEADARLIAAAPDLLVALKDACSALEDFIVDGDQPGLQRVYDDGMAAIAKVEGK